MATSLNYRLTIQFALDGFSYALFDIVYNKLIAWESYNHDPFSDYNDLFNSIEKAIYAKGLHEKNPSITLILDERTNILVPEAIYSPDDNIKLLGFAFNTSSDIVAIADTITQHKAVNVFALPSNGQARIMSKWPEAKITHSSSVFLKNLPKSNEPIVYVNVRNSNFDIAIMKDELLFFNNFQFGNKNDFVYFLLNAMEQYHLSGHNASVCFSGLIDPSSDMIELCKHYVKDIQIVERPNMLQVDDAVAEVPYQYYHIHYQAIR